MASTRNINRFFYVLETFCIGIVCWCNLSVCGFKMIYPLKQIKWTLYESQTNSFEFSILEQCMFSKHMKQNRI